MARPGGLCLFFLSILCACQPLTPFENGPDQRSQASRIDLTFPDFLAISGNELLQGAGDMDLGPAKIHYTNDYPRDKDLPIKQIARLSDELALIHMGGTEEWYTLHLSSGQLAAKEASFKDLKYEALSGFANDDPFFINDQGRLYMQTTGMAGIAPFGGGKPTGRFLKIYRAEEWQGEYQEELLEREVELCAVDSNGQFLIKFTSSNQIHYDWWDLDQDVMTLPGLAGIEGTTRPGLGQVPQEPLSDYQAIWAHQGGFWGMDKNQLYQIKLEKPAIIEAAVGSLPSQMEGGALFRFSFGETVIILDEQGQGFSFHYPSQTITAIETGFSISQATQSSKYLYLMNQGQNHLYQLSPDLSRLEEVGSSQWAEISAFTVSDADSLLIAGRLQGQVDFQVLGIAPDGTESIFPGSSPSPISQIIFASTN